MFSGIASETGIDFGYLWFWVKHFVPDLQKGWSSIAVKEGHQHLWKPGTRSFKVGTQIPGAQKIGEHSWTCDHCLVCVSLSYCCWSLHLYKALSYSAGRGYRAVNNYHSITENAFSSLWLYWGTECFSLVVSLSFYVTYFCLIDVVKYSVN